MRKDAQPEKDLGEERKGRNLFIYSGRTQNNKIISLPAKGFGFPVEAHFKQAIKPSKNRPPLPDAAHLQITSPELKGFCTQLP